MLARINAAYAASPNVKVAVDAGLARITLCTPPAYGAGRSIAPFTGAHRGNSAQAADRTGLIDITEHRTDEGKRYLCAIKDVCSNSDSGATRSAHG